MSRVTAGMAVASVLIVTACVSIGQPLLQTGCWDAHTHVSLYGERALDSLAGHGVTAIRDLGSDLETSLRWRDEVRAGRRSGPRIYTAGVILDGPKQGVTPRWELRTPEDANRAVDSLARRGVDFIKTHNGLSRSTYFAVLRRARMHKPPVASHLPRGVAVWEAIDSGAASIEHMAESILASPLYAGLVGSVDEAIMWWTSPAADSVIRRIATSDAAITPTLAGYAANVSRASTEEERQGRQRVLDALVALTGRLHRAGITLLAGSDVASPDGPIRPGRSLLDELQWLARAGLRRVEVQDAAGRNVEEWFRRRVRQGSAPSRMAEGEGACSAGETTVP